MIRWKDKEIIFPGLETGNSEQTGEINQVEQDQPIVVEDELPTPSYVQENLSLEESKQDALQDSQPNNFESLEYKQIGNEDFYRESSDNLVSSSK